MSRSATVRSVAFDTNAIARLCSREVLGSAALHKLRRQVRQGVARVVIGYPVVAEIAALATSNRPLYVKQMKLVQDLTGGRLLHHWIDRVRLEVRHRSRLRDRHCFMSEARSRAFFRAAFDDVAASGREGERVKRAKERFETELRAAKASLLEEARRDHAIKAEIRGWTKAVTARMDEAVEEWFANTLRDKGELFGVPDSLVAGLRPSEAPTLRADVAFHLAYHLVASADADGTGSFDGNDFLDEMVFVDGVYADEVVTDDDRLHRIARRAATSSGVVLRKFKPWAEAISAAP